MASSEFSKVLVRDERLDCHPSIPFAVYKSGQNVTVATFNAISANSSSHTYNIQVPSETTIIDRRVIWDSVVNFQVNFKIVTLPDDPESVPLMSFGRTEGLSPWPLHSLCTTQQVTINNNSVSINMNDVLPAIVKLGDDRDVEKYNGTAMELGDVYANYSETAFLNNNPLNGYQYTSFDDCYKGRGTTAEYAIQAIFRNGSITQTLSANNFAAEWDNDGTDTALAEGDVVSIVVVARLREPLIISPFIYTHPEHNGQGMYGVQNLNFVFNLNFSQSSGFFRSGLATAEDNPATGAAVVENYTMTIPTNSQLYPAFTNSGSQLIFNFLSPKPSDMLSARNVVPYWEMPRYLLQLSNSSLTPVSAPAPNQNTSSGALIGVNSQTLPSQSIQLNQIPDKLIIFVRRNKAERDPTYTDMVLPIEKISINFNNQSGILASATTDQLWRYSVESGSNQTWEQFQGRCAIGGTLGPNAAGDYPYQCSLQVPTVGSYLMLEMGRHIQITEDYYAPGSLGNFNLQFNVTVNNYSGYEFTNAELVLITVNSGIFVTEKGQSATYTGVLTKDDVLSAASGPSMNHSSLLRMMGGSKLTSALSILSRALPGTNMLAQEFLGDTGAQGIIKKGFDFANQANTALKGQGRSGGRAYGMGKGSAKFLLADRLV